MVYNVISVAEAGLNFLIYNPSAAVSRVLGQET